MRSSTLGQKRPFLATLTTYPVKSLIRNCSAAGVLAFTQKAVWFLVSNKCGDRLGSVGDCCDNAMCESFFATLECELLDRRKFKTRAEARVACFEFIEGWYNPSRRHPALDTSRQSITKGQPLKGWNL